MARFGPKVRSLADRFSTKYVVDRVNGCWIWAGYIGPNGYGRISSGSITDGTAKAEHAHRVSWKLFNGVIPDGLFVCHHCDVRACVNPEHLFLGTNADNLKDMREKGKSNRGTKNGSNKLTELQVIEIRAIGRSQTQRKTAEQFGVCGSVICQIRTRKLWRHI